MSEAKARSKQGVAECKQQRTAESTPVVTAMPATMSPTVAVLHPPSTEHHTPLDQGSAPSLQQQPAIPVPLESKQPVCGLTVAQQLLLARTLAAAGKPTDALAVLDALLLQQPGDAELLYFRGQCFDTAGNAPLAYACYMSALHNQPTHVPSLLAVAAVYKSRTMLPESLAALTQAHQAEPDNQVVTEAMAVVLTDVGTHVKHAGNPNEATTYYERAIQVCPSYAPAHYNLGVLDSEKQQFQKALEHYTRAVELQPGYAEAYCNMGVIYKGLGELEKAVAAYEHALAAAPNFAVVQNNLAIALTDLATQVKMSGELAEAIRLYERALSHNPRYADALYNLGVAQAESGNTQQAIFMYEMALTFNPRCAEAYNNLGVLYKERGNPEKAVECYQAALSIRPNFAQSLNNLGVLYTAQGRAQEGLALLTAAITACPTYAEAYNNLGVLQRDVGSIPDAIASYSRCLEIHPDSRNAGQNRLLALNYIYPGESQLVCQAHANWGDSFQQLHPRLPPTGSPLDLDADRPLRVGYISPDLFTHSVSYFAEAPLAHHNTRNVRHYVYSCVPHPPDAKTLKLKAGVQAAGGVWVEATSMSEGALAERIRTDQIDILVELTGHTAHNRLGVMARKPAPVQATWIGYPNSTGLEAVDYRFTDALCDPEDTEQTFVEELVRLPGCFLCYTPADDAPPVASSPCLTAGYITFGSFNNLAKITPEVVKLWARILLAVPRSRLVLKNKPFACALARGHWLRLFAAEGVDPARIDLLPLAPGNREHLDQYKLMDISLDPFPYAGTTTTTESLYMGVPCITLAGKCHAHNVGVSLLTAVGLQSDWVAHTQDEYVSLAVRHASDMHALGQLRCGLRQRMLSSRLCDAPAFVHQLEGVYRRLWQRYVKQAAGKFSPAVSPHESPLLPNSPDARDCGVSRSESPPADPAPVSD